MIIFFIAMVFIFPESIYAQESKMYKYVFCPEGSGKKECESSMKGIQDILFLPEVGSKDKVFRRKFDIRPKKLQFSE